MVPSVIKVRTLAVGSQGRPRRTLIFARWLCEWCANTGLLVSVKLSLKEVRAAKIALVQRVLAALQEHIARLATCTRSRSAKTKRLGVRQLRIDCTGNSERLGNLVPSQHSPCLKRANTTWPGA